MDRLITGSEGGDDIGPDDDGSPEPVADEATVHEPAAGVLVLARQEPDRDGQAEDGSIAQDQAVLVAS